MSCYVCAFKRVVFTCDQTATLWGGAISPGTRALTRCCLCLLKPGEDSRGLGGFSKGKVKNR